MHLPYYLLSILIFLSGIKSLALPIQIQLDMKKSEYLLYEAIPIVVKITNRSGKTQKFTGNWLDISIFDNHGEILIPSKKAHFKPLEIKAGKASSRSFYLSEFYSISEGRHSVQASLHLGQNSKNSNEVRFNVYDGKELWAEEVGLKTGESFRYELLQFHSLQGPLLYLRIHQLGKSLVATYLLGNFPVKFPQVQLDKENNLHILYLVQAEIYAHLTFSPSGKIIQRTLYERNATKQARFILSSGKISVQGKLYQKKKEKKHKLSELPTYFYK